MPEMSTYPYSHFITLIHSYSHRQLVVRLDQVVVVQPLVLKVDYPYSHFITLIHSYSHRQLIARLDQVVVVQPLVLKVVDGG